MQNDNTENPLHYGAGRIRGWVFCFAVFACPLVYSLKFASFLHPKEILLLLCLALMGALSLGTFFNPIHNKDKTYSPLFLLFGYGIAVFSILSAVYPGAKVLAYGVEYLIGMAMFGMLVLWADDLISDETWARRIWNATIASGFAVALLALGQYAGLLNYMFPVFPAYTQPMYSVFGNQDLLGAYLAVIVPILLHRFLSDEVWDRRPRRSYTDKKNIDRRGRRSHTCKCFLSGVMRGTDIRHEKIRPLFMSALFLAVLAPILIALLLSASRSAWLAAAVGGALIIWRHRDRINWKLHLLPVGLCVYAIAFLNLDFIWQRTMGTFSAGDVGGRARLWFWDGALRMIADNPWVGVGVGSYKYWSPYYQGLALHAPGSEKHFHNTLWTDHAHNEFLEYIAETGAVGAVFLVALLFLLLRCRGVAWVPLISLAICACFTAVLHSVPHAVLGFIFCAGLLSEKPIKLKPNAIKPWHFGRIFLTVFLLPIIPLTLYSFYPTSYLQARAEGAHVNGDPSTYNEYEQAMKAPHWKNYSFYESFGIALLENGYNDEAMFYLLKAKEGLDTGRIHYLLGYTYKQLGARDKALEHYEAALFRWPGDLNTFSALWELTDKSERDELWRHATKFDLCIPDEN